MTIHSRDRLSSDGKAKSCPIAFIGLSVLHEQLIDAALSWLTERKSLQFERVDLTAATIVVLDGRSLEALAGLWAYANDLDRSFLVIGGDHTFIHPRIRSIAPPLSKQAVAAVLLEFCHTWGAQGIARRVSMTASSARRR